MTDGPSPLLTTSAAAAALGVSRYTITRWIREGHLDAKQIGHRYFVTQATLEAFSPPGEPRGDPSPH